MNLVIVFFVPVDATRRDLDEALKEHLAAMKTDPPRKPATQAKPDDPDDLPLWTWFVPNPPP